MTDADLKASTLKAVVYWSRCTWTPKHRLCGLFLNSVFSDITLDDGSVYTTDSSKFCKAGPVSAAASRLITKTSTVAALRFPQHVECVCSCVQVTLSHFYSHLYYFIKNCHG